MNLTTAYLLLGCAIVCEVIGSTFLAKSDGFTKLVPTSITAVMFVLAFYLLSHVVKVMPLGIAYAIWSGVGLVLTALVSVFILKQNIDLPAIIGIGLIVIGVIVMNVFSNSVSH